jgi:hypothetical protein
MLLFMQSSQYFSATAGKGKVMIPMSTVLPVTASLIHITGFILYNVQTKLGKSDPNPVSWFLWAFLATLNALSFSAMNDPVAALQFFAGSVGCVVTFFYVLFIGRFKWPTRREWLTLAVGIISILLWWNFNATAASMVIALIILYSFWPTIGGVWESPFKEKPDAWYLWTIAFFITAVNTYLYKGGFTLSLVVPLVGIVGHGVVAVLSSDSWKRALLR